MRPFSPYLTLLLLLAAAAAIFAGGWRLAKRAERAHLAGDRVPVQNFAAGMQRELGRLERLYEFDLRQLARNTQFGGEERMEVRRQCDGVVGVSQWSLVHRYPGGGKDTHLPVAVVPSRGLPEPVFHINSEGLPREHVILSDDEMFRSGGEMWGWIDEPGKPLLFWQRINDESAVVLLIDPVPLRAALVPWFAAWTEVAFAPVRAAKNPVTVTSPDGRSIATTGPAADAGPNFLLPVHSRFGDWQVAMWDRIETRVVYDARTQATTMALTVLVALVGIIVFVQQRRMLAVAAQRVSFVNRVSHELRAPLTNILLNLDLAADALEEEPVAREPSRRLAMVREEAQRLGRLIENVLAFTRQERGHASPCARACEPASVVQSVVEQFAPSFARRDLSVCITGNAVSPCLMDADAFAQILSNLLSNVEKYVPGGAVNIGLQLANDTLKMTVSDHGPGIPAEAVERIFRPFERLENRVDEGASGTGLGLAIARDLARNCGGSLRLVPSLRGASFELLIPAPPAPAPFAVSA
jgi:signal transduction histidine kinase